MHSGAWVCPVWETWHHHPDLQGVVPTQDVSMRFETCTRILHLSGEDALAVTKKQWTDKYLEEWFSKEFLNLDEALQVFDQQDANMVHAGQKAEATHADERRQWAKHYAKLAAYVQANTSAGVVGKGGRPSKASRAPVSARIPQCEAKQFLPPGAHIWQSRNGRSWCCHVAPRPRFS